MDVELYTFGHGRLAAGDITELLAGAGITSVVDIRSAPGSRHNPDVARSELQRWLPEHGVAYRWDKRLGGFRKTPADSPDVAWRGDAFRAYAAHTRDPRFLAAMDELTDTLALARTAVMCSEAVWWRCHRRVVADFAELARAVPVRHLMHDGRLQRHPTSEGARLREDGLVVYDGFDAGNS